MAKGKRALSGKALAFLFASGILSSSGGGGGGKGGKREVTYSKKRAASVAAARKRGIDPTSRRGYTRKDGGKGATLRSAKGTRSARPVIGGSKAAGLRGGGSKGKPSRAERIAGGRKIAEKAGMDYARRNLPGLALDETTPSGKMLARVKSGGVERTKDPAARFAKVREATRMTATLRGKWEGRASERAPSKAERDATRASRIAAGQSKATQFFAKTAVAEARSQARTGLGHSLRNHASGANKTISVRGRIGAEAIVAPRGGVNRKAVGENRATVFNRVRQEAARYYGLKGASTSGRRDMGAALEAARKNSAGRQAQRASFGRALRKTRREKGGEAARKMLASYRNSDALKWRYLFRK